MKTKAKVCASVVSVLLSVIMLLSQFPIYAVSLQSSAEPVIEVSSAQARPDGEFSVDISFKNNPGIAAALIRVSYDETLLTMTALKYGEAFEKNGDMPPELSSGTILLWNDLKNLTGDAVFATLTFHVNADAPGDVTTKIEVTYAPSDIIDLDENDVSFNVINGVVDIINGIAGDINMDGDVNTKDLLRLRKFFAGWDVEVDIIAVDCNGDGETNAKDLVRFRRWLAEHPVEIYYGKIKQTPCDHPSMTATEAKAATCVEDGNIAYWYCTKCHKYFSDVVGSIEIKLSDTVIAKTGEHTVVIDPAVAPTYTSYGWSEGSHCSTCGKVLVAQEKCDPLPKDQYSIEYFIYGNDEYLAGIAIQNPNPSSYTSDKGVDWLDDLVVPGYNFEGWFDGQGSAASRVTSISAGTARNIKLYAKWTKEEYKIILDNSSMNLPSSTISYTVDQKFTLDKPTVDRYVFLGWTTDRDELISEIKPGTTGNFTLHSNWTSKRNLAKPVANLGDPIIVEDTIEGRILFTYEIGQVENVPLYTLKNLPSAGGIVSVYTETVTKSISTTDASTVAKAIDHITTDSTAWTLSEEWNETTHVEDSVLEEHGYDRTSGQSVGKTSSNTYTLTTNEYDNTVVKANDGTVATTTQYNTNEVDSRATWESKASLSVSDTESAKYTSSAEVSAELGSKVGPVSAKVGASAETSTEISSSTTAGASAETTIAHENTSHSKTGTDTVTVADNTKTTTTDKGWNKSTITSDSSSSSLTKYEEETLSERIATERKYGQSYAKGGSNSTSADWSTSTGESNQYSSTLTYFNSEETTEGVSYTINGESDGSYRLVRAGVVHVFAVVIYDIANAQYSVATYAVLDDETYTYIDYSATSAAKFDDNENGVLPFEVPAYINDYVNGRIVATDGLKYNEATLSTGEYEGSNTSVIIPEFFSVDNQDNTHSAYTIRNLSSETFSGKTELKSVLLSNYIREIPDSAFAGCASLQFIYGSEIRSIGDNAFDGCVSLGEFKVSSTIKSIGENAFRGVDSIVVTASNKNVVFGAINSGAKHITINISAIVEEMSDVTLEIPNTVEYFELQGGRNAFSGLKIKSKAGTTVLNGITITDSNGVPLEISSEFVTLNQVIVESPSYVLLLKSNAPIISLYGTSRFIASSDNAVVCRNVTFDKISSNVSSKLEVTGNLLSYGMPNNSSLIGFPERGEIVLLTASEFEAYIKGIFDVKFNANGGTVSEESRTMYYGQTYGELPVPIRDYYTFEGWYTNAVGGTKITSETSFASAKDITVYAHWSENPTSDWVLESALPECAQTIATKIQYRYRDRTKQTKTSSSSSLSGWTKESGPVYGSWSAWSAWNPGSTSGSDTVSVETATIYGYYYFVCSSCGAHIHSYGGQCYTWMGGCGKYTVPESSYHQVWLTTPWTSAEDTYGTGKKVLNTSTDGRVFTWNEGGSARSGYRTKTRTVTYTFYKWSDYGSWSAWSDSAYTNSESRQVETRKMVQYRKK